MLILVVMAAAAKDSGGPDLVGIAAVITACVGIVGFLASLFKGKSGSQRSEEVERAASYVKGFDALVRRLQDEVEELHEQMAEADRRTAGERQRLEDLIVTLRSDLQEAKLINVQMKTELLELRGQIKGFLTTEQWEEFQRHLD